MTNLKVLMTIAMDRGGTFTYSEAISCGYLSQNISAMVRSGKFDKVSHGVYRLAEIPRGAYDDFVAISLWGRGKSGCGDVSSVIVSHASALAYYSLGDFASRIPIEVTIIGNKKITAMPPVKISRHKDLLGDKMINFQDGFFVSSPLRALIETYTDTRQEKDAVIAAGMDAIRLGMIESPELDESSAIIPEGLLMALKWRLNRTEAR